MGEILFFIIIYTILVFIWGYIYARRKQKDKATNAFLFFLSTILLWMVLSISNFYEASPGLYILMQKVYWIILLNMATVFLYFIYGLLNKKLDFIFYFLLSLNTATIIVRYFLEMDYTQENFWRLDDVKVATLMASIFTLPMLWAIINIIVRYRNTKDLKLKKSLKFLLYGISIATLISVISEYIGPIFIPDLKTFSFMYVAILTLVLFLVLAVVKEQFLNVEMEYIYEELFLNSNEGIILINKNERVVSVNNPAKVALRVATIEKGVYMKDIIKDYDFDKDNTRYEISIESDNEINYLSLSQNVIKVDNKKTMKLLHIINITNTKVEQIAEMNLLNDKSMRDQLTNLYNRRYFNERFLNKNWEFKDNIIIIFIDIDNFKEVNDKHGHLIGDEVLKLAAQSIIDSIRTNEIAIRYGGDEFLIILEGITEKDAYKISNRISKRFKDGIQEEYKIKENLSLSIGLSMGKEDILNLIEQADRAMYYSKSKGKDRCTIYNNGISSECE